MKLFFKNFVAFAVGLALILGGANYAYTRTNGYMSIISDTQRIKDLPDGMKVGNVGSSHGFDGFDYASAGVRGGNLALVGQGLKYDDLILSQNIGKFEKGAALIIPVSYFSLGLNESSEDRASIHPRYYSVVSDAGKIDGFSWYNLIRYRYLPVLSAGSDIASVFDDKDSPYGFDIRSLKESKNRFSESALKKEGLERARHHSDMYDKSVESENIGYVQSMIDTARKNGLKPVLVTTPLTEEYLAGFDKRLRERVEGIAGRLAQKNGIRYLNYSSDSRFSGHPELFLDSDHLNAVGRKLFTGIILKDI